MLPPSSIESSCLIGTFLPLAYEAPSLCRSILGMMWFVFVVPRSYWCSVDVEVAVQSACKLTGPVRDPFTLNQPALTCGPSLDLTSTHKKYQTQEPCWDHCTNSEKDNSIKYDRLVFNASRSSSYTCIFVGIGMFIGFGTTDIE